MTITQTFAEALKWACFGDKSKKVTIAEMHFTFFNELRYTWTAPNDSTVVLWHIKPKEVANAS
jgi:hypothetical protein